MCRANGYFKLYPVLIFFIFSLGTTQGTLQGQAIYEDSFKRITTKDGLINDRIYSIVQDQTGFLWIGTMDGVSRYDGNGFTNFFYQPDDTLSLSGNRINKLFIDNKGILWIGTKGNGLMKYDRFTETFLQFDIPPLSDKISISMIAGDSDQNLWIGSEGNELFKYDPAEKKFIEYSNQQDTEPRLSGGRVSDLYEDKRGNIWLATGNGLNKWRKTENVIEHHFTFIKPERQSIINTIFIDREGNFWLGTHHGIIFVNNQNGDSEAFYPPGQKSYCPENFINDIWQKPDGKLWFGTEAGLYELDPDLKVFTSIELIPVHPHIASSVGVHTFFKDNAGTLWLGTSAGLLQWKPQNLAFRGEHYRLWKQKHLQGSMISSGDSLLIANEDGLTLILPDQDPKVLVDTPLISVFISSSGVIYSGGRLKIGFYTIDPKTKETVHYPWGKVDDLSLPSGGNYLSFAEDHLGFIWIGTSYILNQFDPVSKRFVHHIPDSGTKGKLSGYAIADVLFDSNHNLWITTDHGLNVLRPSGRSEDDPTSVTFELYLHDYLDDQSISCDKTHVLFEDSRGFIWIGSQSGLNKYIPSENAFERYSMALGMPGNHVRGIAEDPQGNLWISFANNGLTKMEFEMPDSVHFTNYSEEEGLIDEVFLNGFAQQLQDGSMLFGSAKGMIHFHLKDLEKKNQFIPPIVITNLYIKNQKVLINDSTGILDRSIIYTPEIILNHDHNIFRIDFSALNFINPHTNQYKYKLENFDIDWQYSGNTHEVTYMNLPQGVYTFKVLGSNNDKVWNQQGATLSIRILPPWWKSPIAWIVYGLLTVSILYSFYRYQLSKKLAEKEAERYREIDELKNDLFANISHEFRTPLTVIQGLTDELSPVNNKEKGFLKVIQQNTKYLTRLVYQILELSRLQTGSVHSEPIQDDMVKYIRYLCGSLQSYAKIKGINLEFHTEMDQLTMDYDPDHIQSIMFNLISNAIKYTSYGGNIWVKLSKKNQALFIYIRDTGHGISKEELPYIFDKYHRVNNSSSNTIEGTGIGLALTRQLVELYHGEIKVESKLRVGTIFTIQLPITRNAQSIGAYTYPLNDHKIEQYLADSDAIIDPSKQKENSNVELPLILIVEDNVDVAYYLRSALHENYRLTFAHNGQEGINKAFDLIPDLIISDVMMPHKNGFQLCETLKNDIKTDHIPIFLLTARADHDSRIEGLSKKADAYIPKPVNKDELLLIINNQLDHIQKLRQKYKDQSYPFTPLPESEKDPFIQNIISLIEAKYTDPEFNASTLEREIGMSKSQLYRKFQAVSGLTPAKMIHEIRLENAQRLILNTQKHISEIAYEVGYKDPGFFSRKFHEKFGSSPINLRNNNIPPVKKKDSKL